MNNHKNKKNTCICGTPVSPAHNLNSLNAQLNYETAQFNISANTRFTEKNFMWLPRLKLA